MEFVIAQQEPEVPSTVSGQALKDVKELKIGNGAYYVDNEGNQEIRDSEGVLRHKVFSSGRSEWAGSDGIVTILIDPEG